MRQWARMDGYPNLFENFDGDGGCPPPLEARLQGVKAARRQRGRHPSTFQRVPRGPSWMGPSAGSSAGFSEGFAQKLVGARLACE
jgi:hypothetical protein